MSDRVVRMDYVVPGFRSAFGVGAFVGAVGADGLPRSGEWTATAGRWAGTAYSGEWREGDFHGRGKLVRVWDGVFDGSREGEFARGVFRRGLQLLADKRRSFDGAFDEEGRPQRGVARDAGGAEFDVDATRAGERLRVYEEAFWTRRLGWTRRAVSARVCVCNGRATEGAGFGREK